MIMIFPPLPQTVPQAYFLGAVDQIQCSIGLGDPQVCYSYMEVGWLVIVGLTQAVPEAPSLDTTIYLTGFTNPYYAASPSGSLLVITVADEQEIEQTIY